MFIVMIGLAAAILILAISFGMAVEEAHKQKKENEILRNENNRVIKDYVKYYRKLQEAENDIKILKMQVEKR